MYKDDKSFFFFVIARDLSRIINSSIVFISRRGEKLGKHGRTWREKKK